ncbi:hypothetical protein KBZ21_36975, partial [Streptomyces sp. A73]|nr:hypothetical protein [Streptomyces sp. A73]
AAATFAAELTEELELPDSAEDACDIADRMGFNPQRWIDAEYTPRNTAARFVPRRRMTKGPRRGPPTTPQGHRTRGAPRPAHPERR